MPAAAASTTRASTSAVARRMVRQAHALREQLFDAWPADELEPLVEAAACAAPLLAAEPDRARLALPWLTRQLQPWEQAALDHAHVLSTEYVGWALPTTKRDHCSTLVGRAQPTALAPHLYEPFLHQYSKANRKRHGVFFTPQPIADYIVNQIDCLLLDEFHLPDGLAAHSALRTPSSALPLFLDPACGTGVFLLTLIDHIHRRITPRCWKAFVPDFLSRLIGIEILPAAAFLAKLNIALKLAETGYDFQQPARINVITGDALSPEVQSQIPNPKSQFRIVLGNPPFSSLTANTNDWIAGLVRGNDQIRGYIRANGQQLNERKTWLHDDYVKFIRLAQWHVEQAGCGIVGLVTNHGYLDNATFRLMRHELLNIFPHIQIVDLHGNRKKHEVAPDGNRDENVFGLDQGVAIGLFCRPPTTLARSASEGKLRSNCNHVELWGPRDAKLASLASASLTRHVRTFSPSQPFWRFIPIPAATNYPEYAAAWSLADAMPVNTTAPVTARDRFVVAFTEGELITRIEQFRDLSISDDQIRERYFTRTRSARYQAGDTRGWQLTTARRLVAADLDWQRHIIRCLYRPFDWRYVFWHPAMIDWPRTEVTRHLLPRAPNPEPRAPLCLLARRQQLPTQPCTFFWIADGLALDGVIRSDNRGSESLFPLYLKSDKDGQAALTANFAPEFVTQFAKTIQLAWQPLSGGDLSQSFGPEDLLAYIYALFHSPNYRQRYADFLRTDFPRILPPQSAIQFTQVSRLGHELINLHLLRRQLSLSPPLPVSPTISNFRAGGYPALKKWLQPKHRSPADREYARTAAAIARTLEIMQAIDEITD